MSVFPVPLHGSTARSKFKSNSQTLFSNSQRITLHKVFFKKKCSGQIRCIAKKSISLFCVVLLLSLVWFLFPGASEN